MLETLIGLTYSFYCVKPMVGAIEVGVYMGTLSKILVLM